MTHRKALGRLRRARTELDAVQDELTDDMEHDQDLPEIRRRLNALEVIVRTIELNRRRQA